MMTAMTAMTMMTEVPSRVVMLPSYTRSQLEDLVGQQPDVYKRCIANIDCARGMHARAS
jgi:hypothetical protein